MSDVESFFSFSQEAVAEQTIDKSVFIAVALPARSLPELAENMRQIRAAYPKARHYVYAYRLWRGRAEKASDDGEPQGTGGRPVLDALAHRQIWDAQIIVVRYFGGVLLGTGGLTRAYGGTARLALAKAEIYRMSEHWLLSLCVPYAFYDEFRYMSVQRKWTIESAEYEEQVLVQLAVPVEEGERLTAWLEGDVRGRLTYLSKERVWRKAAP